MTKPLYTIIFILGVLLALRETFTLDANWLVLWAGLFLAGVGAVKLFYKEGPDGHKQV